MCRALSEVDATHVCFFFVLFFFNFEAFTVAIHFSSLCLKKAVPNKMESESNKSIRSIYIWTHHVQLKIMYQS